MRMWMCLTQWVKDLGIATGCGIGHRHGSDLSLLWLWLWPAAIAVIRPLAWEPSYAVGVALKRQKTKKKSLFQQGPENWKSLHWRDKSLEFLSTYHLTLYHAGTFLRYLKYLLVLVSQVKLAYFYKKNRSAWSSVEYQKAQYSYQLHYDHMHTDTCNLKE